MLFESMFTCEFASRAQEQHIPPTCIFFQKPFLLFLHCVFHHLRHVQKQRPWGPFSFFRSGNESLALSKSKAPCGREGVWSVSVVLSVSVEGAMECQMRVNDVFCTISPSQRGLCDHRFVIDSGTLSASAILLLPRPRAAICSMAKSTSAERTILVVSILVNT